MSPRWKPLPASLPAPTRRLAEHMRMALDRTGLSLRRLAADDEVHYSLTALHRFFSGQAHPPRQLLDVLARRCGADPARLLELYERARTAVDEPAPATTRRPRRHRGIAVGVGLFTTGLIAGIAIAHCAEDPPAGNQRKGTQQCVSVLPAEDGHC